MAFGIRALTRLYSRPPVVAVLRLSGIIGQMGGFRRGLNLASLAGPIERAFKTRRVQAVALAINSPGGSPVQATLIAKRIRSLAAEHDMPVFAFAEDVAASGGYWLACAGDEIYAEASSIIGSIGVVTSGFGFQGLLDRLGVERRLHTAGENKGMLDPFLDEKAEDVERLTTIQGDVHEDFKALVRDRRGKRLKGDEEELFSGAFWTGRTALELGLIDGIGDIRTIMRDRFGDDVRLRPVGMPKRWLRRRLGFADMAAVDPVDWAAGALTAVEERLWWNRFGL
jgi:signal peptide peptidase SppA